MKTIDLRTTEPSIAAPLNAMNRIIRDGLARATRCLFQVTDLGATVTRVTIERDKPVLWLDAPPRFADELSTRITTVTRGPRTDQLLRAQWHEVDLAWYQTERRH